jgi:hypothetical protein
MGGVLCPMCSKSPENMSDMKKDLSLPHYILISDLFSRRFKDFRNVEFDNAVLEDVYRLISDYFNYHTDCHIDCYNYLNKFAAGVKSNIKATSQAI